MLEATNDLILRTENRLYGHHQRLIVINQGLIQEENMKDLLDFFIRDSEVRASSQVMISDERAESVLEFRDADNIPAFHITEISEKDDITNKLTEKTTLAQINTFINANASFLVQKIVTTNEGIKLQGASVIDGDTFKQVGSLSSEEVSGVNWIIGDTAGGVLKSKNTENDQSFIFEIGSIIRDITPNISNDVLSFGINIQVQGRIPEVVKGYHHISSEELLPKLEKQLSEDIKNKVNRCITKLQEDLKVDPIHFGEEIRIKYPAYWEKNKNEWDDIFSQAKIHTEVEVQIIDYGTNLRD